MSYLGQVETIEIGLGLDLGKGDFENCEWVEDTLKLTKDENGQYHTSGQWTSEVTELKDKFKKFDKVVLDKTLEGNATTEVFTRTSEDGISFSEWEKLQGNEIAQGTSRYVQVRVDLIAGYTTSSKETSFVNVDLEGKVKDHQHFTSDKDGVKLSKAVPYKVKKSSVVLEEGLVSEVEINIDDFETISNFNFTVQ